MHMFKKSIQLQVMLFLNKMGNNIRVRLDSRLYFCTILFFIKDIKLSMTKCYELIELWVYEWLLFSNSVSRFIIFHVKIL